MSPEEHFEQYVVARRGALLRTAYLLTGNLHDAEDLVQRALVKAVAKWPRIMERPEPYVRRILYRENVSRWRRRPVGEHLAAEVPERPDEQGSDHAGRLAVRAALLRLTPRQRAVLVCRFYDDLTEVQTAEVLGVGVGTVKSQTRHALKRLRELAPDLQDVRTGASS